jgi:hypothetical protein
VRCSASSSTSPMSRAPSSSARDLQRADSSCREADRSLMDSNVCWSPRIHEMRQRWRYHADLLDQLRGVPRLDCGSRFAPCAMEVDHRDPATKVAAVTRMIANASWRRIAEEAAKCDIVCSNCHRLRTFRRRQEGGSAQSGSSSVAERWPSKPDVAGSNPVSRSSSFPDRA